MVTTADALIIGAGTIGASTALELSRRGVSVHRPLGLGRAVV